jgi:hypothetical protein
MIEEERNIVPFFLFAVLDVDFVKSFGIWGFNFENYD